MRRVAGKVHCSSKKFERMAREAMDIICLWVLKESNKSRFNSYCWQEQCIIEFWSYSMLPYGTVTCTLFPTTFLKRAVNIIVQNQELISMDQIENRITKNHYQLPFTHLNWWKSGTNWSKDSCIIRKQHNSKTPNLDLQIWSLRCLPLGHHASCKKM